MGGHFPADVKMTVRRDLGAHQNPVKHLKWSFSQK